MFLAILVAVPVAAYIISSTRSKVYGSSVLMEVEPTALDNPQPGSAGASTPNPQFVSIAARLIQTSGVGQAAARQLNLPPSSYRALLAAITVSTDPNTGFITITARSGSADQAAQIANAFGQAINAARATEAIRQIDSTLNNLQASLNALPPQSQARNQQIAQIQRLRAQRDAQGTNTQVIEPAVPSTSPDSPRPLRDAGIALVVAIFLGLGGVALAETFDRRIRRLDEAESLSGMPVLTMLPKSAFDGDVSQPAVAERFRSLRANLTFFNIDRDVRSIAVVSSRSGEGKTLVSIGLAQAYAAAGAKVILVDGDLRRPRVASRLGMPAATGLAKVLVGEVSVHDALLQQMAGGSPTGLHVLPAGDVPPNPAELLSSGRMQRLLDELSEMCDLLIIDTSPLLAVSDALPLLEKVTGTLLVLRLGAAQREDMPHLRRIIGAARSASLGVIATGATKQDAYPYDHAYPPSSANGVATAATARASVPLVGRLRR